MGNPVRLKHLNPSIDGKVATLLKNKDNFKSEALTGLLAKDPQLAAFYEAVSKATGGKTESVLASTQRTLNTAETHRHHLEPLVAPLMSWPEFRLFLALQDLGRGYVLKNIGTAPSKTEYSLRARALKASRRIISAVLPKLGYDENKIILFTSLLKYDVITLLFQDILRHQGAVAFIQDIANRTGRDEEDIAKLLTALHIAKYFDQPEKNSKFFKKHKFVPKQGVLRTVFDVFIWLLRMVLNILIWPFKISYYLIKWIVITGISLFKKTEAPEPTVPKPKFHYRLFTTKGSELHFNTTHQAKLDRMFEPLVLAKRGESTLISLVDAAKKQAVARTTSTDLLKRFIRGLPALNAYLVQQNRRMLSQKKPDDDAAKQHFRGLKRDLRDLLFYLVRIYVPDNKGQEFLDHYKKLIRCDVNLYNLRYDFCFETLFERYIFRPNNCGAYHLLGILFDQILIQRQYYLARYKQAKVLQKADEVLNKAREDKKAVGDDTSYKKVAKLLGITFVHGSKSIIFANTHHTHNTLLPTGHLNKLNIVPLSGEVYEGARLGGVNNAKLSGVALDLEGWARGSYANPEYLGTNRESEIQLLDEFLAPDFIDSWGIHMKTTQLQRLAIAIKRIRILWPDEYEQRKDDIKTKIQSLPGMLSKHKQLEWYKDRIQTDNDLQHRVKEAEYALSNLVGAMGSELPRPKNGMDAVKNTFPMLFASRALLATLANRNEYERVICHGAKLGRDIQYVFVKEDKMGDAQQLLAESGLKDKVTVLKEDDLCQAGKLNSDASSYLTDILGSKLATPQPSI